MRGLTWVAAAAVYHVALAALFAHSHGQGAEQTLAHFDSNWFADLVTSGRGPITDAASESRWAFYPLYLWLVALLPGSPFFAGAALSLACALAFGFYASQRAGHWGWFLLAFSPASFVLFTFHTEALFLFASAVCWFELERRFAVALVALAVCVLTRNQGVFVAVVMLFACTTRRRALAVALVWLAAEVVLLGYAWRTAGTPWAYVQAQAHWPHATGPLDVLRTVWMGNQGDPLQSAWLVRHLYALGWLVFSVVLVRTQRRDGAYSLLSSGVMFLQGTLQNAFRFSAVVFPALFALGERVQRQRWFVQAAVAAVWLALHHWVTLTWLRDGWPY